MLATLLSYNTEKGERQDNMQYFRDLLSSECSRVRGAHRSTRLLPLWKRFDLQWGGLCCGNEKHLSITARMLGLSGKTWQKTMKMGSFIHA